MPLGHAGVWPERGRDQSFPRARAQAAAKSHTRTRLRLRWLSQQWPAMRLPVQPARAACGFTCALLLPLPPQLTMGWQWVAALHAARGGRGRGCSTLQLAMHRHRAHRQRWLLDSLLRGPHWARCLHCFARVGQFGGAGRGAAGLVAQHMFIGLIALHCHLGSSRALFLHVLDAAGCRKRRRP